MSKSEISLARIVKVVLLGFMSGLIVAGSLMALSRIAAEVHSTVLDDVLQTTSPFLWPFSASLSGSSNSPGEEYAKWAVAFVGNGFVYSCVAGALYVALSATKARRVRG